MLPPNIGDIAPDFLLPPSGQWLSDLREPDRRHSDAMLNASRRALKRRLGLERRVRAG